MASAADDGLWDLSQLDSLNDDSILQVLKSRYDKDKIYTNCGDILIALNPCKELPIFGRKQHGDYNWNNITTVPPPHIFYAAARAYSRMRQTSTNQVILVSGESGAGKTESTKYMVKHFVTMCPQDTGDLHDRIVKVNPLLEAFGNAKTIMNTNSSRFAKYLELSFQEDGQVLGAVVRDYMLEKSRVTAQNADEGNFHIFYALFAGASPELLSGELGLQKPESYRIIKGNRDLLRATDHYAKVYRENMDVLRTIGLEKPDIEIIHHILGATLHLSQIEFTEPKGTNDPLLIQELQPLQKAADLLSISPEALGHALIAIKTKFAGDEVVRNKTLPQANDGRDALAKALYERLFGWLVRKINENLHPSRNRSQLLASIGILDIAGFEKLQTNSFEQMCINFVNERLQNFTNRNVFEDEMSVYREEGLQMANTRFENNDRLIDMFNKKQTGILALLDETTKLGMGTDAMFIQRLVENYENHPHFIKCERNVPQFGIKHYAGQVWYSGEDFLEKNRDMLNEGISQCMKKSENDFIVDLFQVKKGPTGTISATMHKIRQSRKPQFDGPRKPATDAGKQLMMELGKSLVKRYGDVQPSIQTVYNPKDHSTVVSYFSTSMGELLRKMRQAEPYFVRCLKPNSYLQPDNFDDMKVKEQLLYNGISAIAEIRKMNLPVRKTYKAFTERYRILMKNAKFQSAREGTSTILKKVLPQHMVLEVKMGKTKVFMKDETSIALERILARKENRAAAIVCRTIRSVAEHKTAEKKIRELKERQLKTERELKERQLKNDYDSAVPLNHDNRDSGSSNSSESPNNAESSDDDTEDSDSSRIKVNTLKDSVRFNTLKDVDKPSKSQKETKEPETPKNNEDESHFWDIFQIISREAKSQDVHRHRYLQILKIITYALLTIILLFCLIAQKVSLMTLVSDPKDPNDVNLKSARYVLVLVALCIPYGLIFLSNLWKSLFGNVPMPSKRSIIMVMIMEGLHTCGLSLLVFRVLPEIDVVRGVMVLSATCMLPSILKPMCSNNKVGKGSCTSICGKMCELIFDLLACLAQISAIPLLVLDHYYIRGEIFAQDKFKIVEVAFALFLCSFSWWENYIDDRFCGQLSQTNSLHIWMLGIKFDLQESRPIIFTLVALLKAGIAILLAFFLKDEALSFDLTSIIQTLDTQSADVRLNASIITLTISAFVGYYTAYTACKLQMQRVAFAIPLLLATPAAVAVVYFDCEYKFLDTVSQEARNCDPGNFEEWWHMPIAAAWLLSVYWVSRHIWFPSQSRLAKVENLFLNPLYCGILLEQHLALNRRRHTRKITKSAHGSKKTFKLSTDNASPGAGQDSDNFEKRIPPMIYACGTMWHENRQEMVQILKSLFRMDKDQFIRKQAVIMNVPQEEAEYYEFEPHILFDDAFETNDDNERVPNGFVRLLTEVIDEAASSVHEKPMTIEPPFKIPSPYGGQLVYLMPGGNLMFVHLKDKNKIRHRKRWSQVMYMYYLLGYRIIKECQERVLRAIEAEEFNSLISWREFEKNVTGQMGKSQVFQFLDDEVLYRAENTFILALDGDVDFTPGAVRMLLDKMQKNPRVGASCGRIHPIGKGPMVWYQKFEYAVAHWLQKATEHVLGCVLCSPGCFSMFRGSALMDDNVMKKYTILPTEASHHLMYDQGEDRWLCTLLLQQGYRVDYAAASDAFTYAPEGFDEFFNQRRRWMPSTIANILDLLQDGKNTVAINNNISWLYIFYQGSLMVSTVLGPSTVLMMIAGAIMTVFSVDLVWSYVISCAPAVVFTTMCFFVKAKYQLIVAEFLSAVYIFIMMVVFVGCIITAAQESPLHPSVLFLSSLVLIFLVAAMLHPQEFSCIIYGALYFVCVPMGYLLLVVYSLCNLNVVSWGTREVPKKKTKAELEEEEKLKKEKEEKKKQGFLSRFMPKVQFQDFAKVFGDMQQTKKKEDETVKLLEQMNKNFEVLIDMQHKQNEKLEPQQELQSVIEDPNAPKPLKSALKRRGVKFDVPAEKESDEDHNEEVKDESVPDKVNDRIWVEEEYLGKGPVMNMYDQEEKFWDGFIKRYLQPLDPDKQKQKATAEKLIELRNSVCGGMAIINLLWLAINFMFQLKKPAVITFPLATNANESDVNENNIKIDVLGLMFIIFFVIILLIQCIGMVVHRWGTLLHLLAITEIPNPFKKSIEDLDQAELGKDKKETADKVLQFCDKLLSEPAPDYPDDDEDQQIQERNTTHEMMREALKNLSETGVRDAIGTPRGDIGASMRDTRGGLGISFRHKSVNFNQSYSNQIRQSKGRTIGDVNFRQSIGNFLLRASRTPANEFEYPDNSGETGRPYRRPPKPGGVQLGATLLNNVTEEPPRRFGSQLPFQKDLLKRAKDRNLDGKIKGLRRRGEGAANGGGFGQSISRDRYRETEEEEEDIYDEIPAAGTLSRHFNRKFVRFQQQHQNSNHLGRSRSRNSGVNQWLS